MQFTPSTKYNKKTYEENTAEKEQSTNAGKDKLSEGNNQNNEAEKETSNWTGRDLAVLMLIAKMEDDMEERERLEINKNKETNEARNSQTEHNFKRSKDNSSSKLEKYENIGIRKGKNLLVSTINNKVSNEIFNSPVSKINNKVANEIINTVQNKTTTESLDSKNMIEKYKQNYSLISESKSKLNVRKLAGTSSGKSYQDLVAGNAPESEQGFDARNIPVSNLKAVSADQGGAAAALVEDDGDADAALDEDDGDADDHEGGKAQVHMTRGDRRHHMYILRVRVVTCKYDRDSSIEQREVSVDRRHSSGIFPKIKWPRSIGRNLTRGLIRVGVG